MHVSLKYIKYAAIPTTMATFRYKIEIRILISAAIKWSERFNKISQM
jgi:hypothetical protein